MYKKIFNTMVFPVVELASKTSIQKKLEFLIKSQYFTEHEIGAYQESRLKAVIKHAYENVPYYRNLFDSLKIKPEDIKSKKDLKKLPFLTKKLVNEHYDELLARDYLGKSKPKSTSGSSGEPTVFYQTKEDFSWIWASHFRAWSWFGCRIGDKYVKISVNEDRHRIDKKIQDALFRCLYIHIKNMNNHQIDEHITKIIRYGPAVIYGYSSSINAIAERMIEKNVYCNCKGVITTGDALLPSFRKNIECRFLCKVYDEYGCGGEGLYIAAQCEEGSYHISDELMIVEVESGEVIVTSFNNYAMPLIRYKPGDLAVPGQCKCGRTLSVFKKINGRSHDVVKTIRGDILNSPFFETVFESISGVSQFQIIQKDMKGIMILIKKGGKYSKATAEKKIRQNITDAAGKPFDIDIVYVENILSEKNGKVKSIKSSV